MTSEGFPKLGQKLKNVPFSSFADSPHCRFLVNLRENASFVLQVYENVSFVWQVYANMSFVWQGYANMSFVWQGYANMSFVWHVSVLELCVANLFVRHIDDGMYAYTYIHICMYVFLHI